MRPGFLLAASSGPNYDPDGRRDRRERRKQHGGASLGQPERKKVLSIVVSSDVVTGPERFQLLTTTERIEWTEESKSSVYCNFVSRPDRQAEEDAFYECGFGTPSNSSISEYEYSEPAPGPPVTSPLSVQAMRASCRQEFLSWWARRIAKEARHGKPVLRSYPSGQPANEAVLFDTRGTGEEAELLGRPPVAS